jgi:hypothetical protein
MLSESSPDLAANAPIAIAGEAHNGFGEFGFDPRAEVNQMFVDGVVHGHGRFFGYFACDRATA